MLRECLSWLNFFDLIMQNMSYSTFSGNDSAVILISSHHRQSLQGCADRTQLLQSSMPACKHSLASFIAISLHNCMLYASDFTAYYLYLLGKKAFRKLELNRLPHTLSKIYQFEANPLLEVWRGHQFVI